MHVYARLLRARASRSLQAQVYKMTFWGVFLAVVFEGVFYTHFGTIFGTMLEPCWVSVVKLILTPILGHILVACWTHLGRFQASYRTSWGTLNHAKTLSFYMFYGHAWFQKGFKRAFETRKTKKHVFLSSLKIAPK